MTSDAARAAFQSCSTVFWVPLTEDNSMLLYVLFLLEGLGHFLYFLYLRLFR